MRTLALGAAAGAVDEVLALRFDQRLYLKHRVVVNTWEPLQGGWCWAGVYLETKMCHPG